MLLFADDIVLCRGLVLLRPTRSSDWYLRQENLTRAMADRVQPIIVGEKTQCLTCNEDNDLEIRCTI